MLLRAIRLAENLAILSLLTGSAVAMQLTAARARRRGVDQKLGSGNSLPGRANR
jgi:hypothetical protein